MRIAIQGEPGSNSHLAVEALLGPTHDLVPCTLSAQVFERLARHDADAAVLPIENSLHGAVADHDDLLLEHDATIVGEIALRIRHALIAVPGGSPDQMRQVLSHPVALSQCRRFFLENPQVQATPFYDTAGAVKHVMAGEDPALAAIAAPKAAEVYGGTILRQHLEDDAQNFTRFFLLGGAAQSERVRLASSVAGAPRDKMSVAFSVPHRPGSLVEVLQKLAEANADLTRIQSRPVAGKPWEYVFFVDLRLHQPETAAAVRTLLQQSCRTVRFLGWYGSVQPHNVQVRAGVEANTGR